MDSTIQAFQHRTLPKWPLSKRTRQILVKRMIENLTTPSVFSRLHGLLSKEIAEEYAKQMEGVAFVTANQHYLEESDVDGNSAIQLYDRESHRLMLELLETGPRRNNAGEVMIPERVTSHQAVFHLSCGHDRDVMIPERVTSHQTIFDISGGRQAFLEAEEAEELLKPLSEPGSSYTKICFSNRSFGLDAACVAEPILLSLKDQLTEVDLSDFIAGRPEAEALDVITIFSAALEGCELKYLNLSNNALGEKGVRAFGALLKSQNNLEELYLMNDGISKEAARAVRELIPSTEKLRVLHFHSNMTGDEGAIAISEIVKHSHALEDFRCSSSRVGSEGGVSLAEALRSRTRLKKLDLRDNMFGVEARVALSNALSGFADLTEVYLSYLNFKDEGAIALANSLKDSAPSLEVLEMAGNGITGEAASALSACITVKQFLIKLNLAENELKDEGAILIAKALDEGHGHLNEVDLSSNLITWAGARLLAQAVTHKPRFSSLNLKGNFISDEWVDEMNYIIKISHDVLGPLDENDEKIRMRMIPKKSVADNEDE